MCLAIPFVLACLWLLFVPGAWDYNLCNIPVLSVIGDGGLENSMFNIIETDPLDEIAMLGLLISIVFVALSKENGFFEKIENLTNKIKKTQFKKLIPEKLTKELSDAYIEMYEKTDRYIALKKVLPYTERGKKRVEVAKGLKKLAEETLDKLGIKFEKENEKTQEDKNIAKDTKENDGPEL